VSNSEAKPRIGVFVCCCGSNIAGYVDVPAVAKYARTLPNVVLVQENLYTCSEGGINEIKNAIVEQQLNRVVVASCTPRTHEPLFRNSCKEAGLNPYLFEMVNIRDQCSWVHMKEREKGTEKAKDLIRMGVAKAAMLTPLDSVELGVTHSALVIGGGIAGMSAAESLAGMGYPVILVEKQRRLGGLLNQLHKIYPGARDPRALLEEHVDRVTKDARITVITDAEVQSVDGYIGNFNVGVSSDGRTRLYEVGALVVATGATVRQPPDGVYEYDGRRVITQIQLERRLSEGIDPAPRNVVMVQCVGARVRERPYCSRICCQIAIKNALEIRRLFPDTHVSILYRDLQMYGVANEEMLRKAKEAGVRFMYYDVDRPPEVENEHVKISHQLLGKELDLPADLVILSTPLVANEDAPRLSGLLRVPLDANNFFLEGHVKLKPLDFASEGIYLCGSARYPANLAESIAQGLGAASRAATLLSKEHLYTSGITASVNPESCVGCLGCVQTCPFQAISFDPEQGVCKVNPVLCKGCGTCAATCPSQSIQLMGFTPKQLYAQIDQVLADD